jgi:hypothetical protein
MPAPNYMQFSCALSRARKRARTQSETIRAQVFHAEQQALIAYKLKEYVMAEQWCNAATRASLQMC